MDNSLETMLAGMVRAAVKEEVRNALEEYRTESEKREARPMKTYTRQQVAEILHVSYVTLWQWEKEKKLMAQRAGRRVVYQAADVHKLLTNRA